ncbi:hypothetical protein HQ585_12520 [candidate division KSB1 bacterium]|nr:hypothetical protein [candidate division KSB1 bacterium]
MKTTNLIIDFLIIGFVGIITLLIPQILINNSLIKDLFTYKIPNLTFFIAALTIFTYLCGIVYNQICDFILKITENFFRLNVIDEKEKELFENNYHLKIQNIVLNSQTSFNYLSYRRTMIRIIRSIFISTPIIVILHITYSCILLLLGKILFFSFPNLLIIIAMIGLTFYFRHMYVRIYLGYYDAVINFSKLIDDQTQRINLKLEDL